MACKHNNLIFSILTTLSLVAVFLHMVSHLIPLILVSVSHDTMEIILRNPFVTVAAWSFLPLMIYHIWHDRKMHKEIHRLQNQIKTLTEVLDHES